MKLTKGRRIESPFAADGALISEWPKPGDYWKQLDGWYGETPNNHMANLSGHAIVEHDNGTITVSPSIGVGTDNCDWHGYLERGVWREC